MPEEKTILAPSLQEVVERVVAVAHPVRIVLFGSAAREEAGPHSDIDLLVIVEEPVHRGHLTGQIYMNLLGVEHAVDVVVVTPEDVERYRSTPSLIIKPALAEGQIIYDREAVSAG